MVEEEPRHRTMKHIREPDIVGTVGHFGVVDDIQVAGQHSDLE